MGSGAGRGNNDRRNYIGSCRDTGNSRGFETTNTVQLGCDDQKPEAVLFDFWSSFMILSTHFQEIMSAGHSSTQNKKKSKMEVKIPSDERAASTAVPNSVVIRLKIPRRGRL